MEKRTLMGAKHFPYYFVLPKKMVIERVFRNHVLKGCKGRSGWSSWRKVYSHKFARVNNVINKKIY